MMQPRGYKNRLGSIKYPQRCRCGCRQHTMAPDGYVPGHQPKPCADGCGQITTNPDGYATGHKMFRPKETSK